MHVDEMLQSKYLKASDLKDKPHVVVIERLEQATFKNRDGKEEKKWIMFFRGKQKALALNVTNIKKLAKIHGKENLMWPGKYIEIYPTETNFGGEDVECIRIRDVSPPEVEQVPSTPVTKPAATEVYRNLDDEIPF